MNTLLAILLVVIGLLPAIPIAMAFRWEARLRSSDRPVSQLGRWVYPLALYVAFECVLTVAFVIVCAAVITVTNAHPDLRLWGNVSAVLAFSLCAFGLFQSSYLLVLFSQIRLGRLPSPGAIYRVVVRGAAFTVVTYVFLFALHRALRFVPALGEGELRFLAVFALYTVTLAFALPWVIAVFYRPKPLAADLEGRVRELARAAGVPSPRLRVLDLGEIDVANAWVAGLSRRNRTVWFTRSLLERLDRDETLAIAAHELGHVRWHHLPLFVLLTLASMVGSWVLAGLLPFENPGLVRLARVGLFFALTATALYAAYRRCENAADRFAVGLTGDPDALANALRKLHEKRPERPGWTRFFSTHPTLDARLRRIERYARAASPPTS